MMDLGRDTAARRDSQVIRDLVGGTEKRGSVHFEEERRTHHAQQATRAGKEVPF